MREPSCAHSVSARPAKYGIMPPQWWVMMRMFGRRCEQAREHDARHRDAGLERPAEHLPDLVLAISARRRSRRGLPAAPDASRSARRDGSSTRSNTGKNSGSSSGRPATLVQIWMPARAELADRAVHLLERRRRRCSSAAKRRRPETPRASAGTSPPCRRSRRGRTPATGPGPPSELRRRQRRASAPAARRGTAAQHRHARARCPTACAGSTCASPGRRSFECCFTSSR